MKILHITASYKPAYIYGGPIMSVAKLCEELNKVESEKLKVESWSSEVGSQRSEVRSPKSEIGSLKSDINITVYTTLANGKEELPYLNGVIHLVDGVEVQYFKRITKDHSHLSPALLWHLWKTVKQFDVVQIHAWWNLVTMPACLIAVFRGVKVILTPRGTLSNYSFEVNNSKLKGIFHQYFGKFLLNRTYFHCTSAKEVEDTKTLLNPKRIFNFPNFVNLPWQQHFERFKSNGNDPLRLVFLSRIEQKKGLELLFEVLAEFRLDWELTIVGIGQFEYVESLKWKVESLKLGEHIQWLGAAYGDAKFELLAQHDYLILPSFDENFANVVIESLFVGTPVILTKNVGLSDYVIDKDMGLVCDRNAEDLKNILVEAQNARQENRFNPEILTTTIAKDYKEEALRRQYLMMYEEVVKG